MAVKLIAVLAATLPVGVRAAVTVGLWLTGAVTVTFTVAVPVPPLPSDTVTLAAYVPAAA